MRGLLVGGVMCLAVAGCGGGHVESGPTQPPSTRPHTFDVSGFVTANGSFGLACKGLGGSADLHPGTRVVVRDADGSRVGSGVLGDGFADDDAPQRRCIFPFTVARVPDGKGPFSVQVGRRAPVPFRRDHASQVTVRLP